MLKTQIENVNIILASASPRRKQLLNEMGLQFSTEPRQVDEVFPESLSPKDAAEFLSQLKATAFRYDELGTKDIVITADTIVTIDDIILGKPANADEAFKMLKRLSGKTHEVITGITLKSNSKQKTFSSITQVSFKILTNEEINYYIEQYQPFDKAGAYGIQEWIGYTAINGIKGSYFNVVGLPTHQLYSELISFIQEVKN